MDALSAGLAWAPWIMCVKLISGARVITSFCSSSIGASWLMCVAPHESQRSYSENLNCFLLCAASASHRLIFPMASMGGASQQVAKRRRSCDAKDVVDLSTQPAQCTDDALPTQSESDYDGYGMGMLGGGISDTLDLSAQAAVVGESALPTQLESDSDELDATSPREVNQRMNLREQLDRALLGQSRTKEVSRGVINDSIEDSSQASGGNAVGIMIGESETAPMAGTEDISKALDCRAAGTVIGGSEPARVDGTHCDHMVDHIKDPAVWRNSWTFPIASGRSSISGAMCIEVIRKPRSSSSSESDEHCTPADTSGSVRANASGQAAIISSSSSEVEADGEVGNDVAASVPEGDDDVLRCDHLLDKITSNASDESDQSSGGLTGNRRDAAGLSDKIHASGQADMISLSSSEVESDGEVGLDVAASVPEGGDDVMPTCEVTPSAEVTPSVCANGVFTGWVCEVRSYGNR